MAVIIAKNVTQNDIEISDMYGTTIPSSSQLTLTESLPYPIIENSQNLKTYVQDGDIVINDGVQDLSVNNGLKHLRISTYYETPRNIFDLDDVPEHPGENKILSTSSDSLVWSDNTGNTGNTDINFCFFENGSRPYLKCNSSSWSIMASFIFRGTNVLGIPTAVEITAYNKENRTGGIRLYDYTNNNVICQTTVNSKTRQILVNTSLSNLPTEKSIIEIQGYISNRDLFLESLLMRF